MKKVIILGSTGSIGRNAVQVIRRLTGFRVVGLATFGNYRLLADQTMLLKPQMVTLIDKRHHKYLKSRLNKTKLLCGEQGITEMIEALRADKIICALASSIGIRGIMCAIEKKMELCLATKEILVNYGDLVIEKARKSAVRIIPIDSEHSAIYQCLEGRNMNDVMTIILTASGGPFLNKSLRNVTKEDVLNHPVWKMGRKITVDSATMMNKGLEVIEAHHLFGFPPEMIKVVIHPEAICHSLVQFKDGTMLAQLSTPDMRLPIQYALTEPNRLASCTRYLDIWKTRALTFAAPDYKKFPLLNLAYEALRKGRTMPAVLNTANEEAVRLFLEDRIKFLEIPKIVESVVSQHQPRAGDLEHYMQTTEWARERVKELI